MPSSRAGGSVVTATDSGAGAGFTYGDTLEEVQAETNSASATNSAAGPSFDILRLGVGADLLAQRLVVDAGLQVVLKTIGERDHHVRDAAVLDQLGEQRAAFAAVVVAQEIAHHVEREIALEIENQIFEEVLDELFHGTSPPS